MLQGVVSLAAQSIIGHLPVDVPHVGVVGEIVAQFWEYVNQCSHLEAAGLGVCDLVLRPAGNETNVVAHLEEVAGRLRMARGGQGGPRDLTSQAHGLVLREPDGVTPLEVALPPSSLSGPSKMQVSAAARNGVQRGFQLALTTVLSHFPELEVELDLLESSNNADLSCDEMETLWTRTVTPAFYNNKILSN
jgi:hypothetical protein